LKLTALVVEGRIEDARFLVRGCTSSIACGSALAEWLIQSAIDDLQRKTGAEIAAAVEAEVGGLTSATRHAAQLMADGVRELLKRLDA
jgi:NifU-like protein involved in Fe-S cluster formation